MTNQKVIAGVGLAVVVLALAGAAVSLPAALETVAGIASVALVAAVVLAVVGAGVGGARGAGDLRTPYW